METWQIAALAAVFFLAAYAIAVKYFFNSKYDWRAFIPLLLVTALALSAYFIYSGAQAQVKADSYTFAIVLGIIFCLSTVASFIAMKDGPVSVVVPIFSMNLILVAVGGAILFGEQITGYKLAGIFLGLISLVLLTIETK